MKRDLRKLSDKTYDLLVIGGGIYGACIAWDASLRGLSVALVEKGDFGSATSANSLKIIHGGLRYLQHGDVRRMRQSIAERKALMRIAPHLIHPLPVVLPSYGHGLKGPEVLSCALKVNDLIGLDRNWGLSDPQKHIPPGKVLSMRDCLNLIPGIPRDGLTGGVLFYDAQVYNSERLVLAFLQSAVEQNADVANYAEVTGFCQMGDRIVGATVSDRLSEDSFDIRARLTINASGPWINRVLGLLNGRSNSANTCFAKAINVVVRPLFSHQYAVGISGRETYHDQDTLLDKGSRFFFMAPWRGKTLLGTDYLPYEGGPEGFRVTQNDIDAFLKKFNQAYPAANLKIADVSFVQGGLLPSSGLCSTTGSVQLTKSYQLHNHQRDGFKGLLSVTGVKYTTARGVAQHVVDQAFQILDKPGVRSTSSTHPLYGGQIDGFTTSLQTAQHTGSSRLSEASIRRLLYNYGSSYLQVLSCLDNDLINSHRPIEDLAVLRAEVRYGVREEMAQKLSDVVLRRGELGTAEVPDDSRLSACAETMGAELGWSLSTMQSELEEMKTFFEYRVPVQSVSMNSSVGG
ncbi:MAG: FAD-dependent oxidoreductase [Elainellaceae cyanobacterium]